MQLVRHALGRDKESLKPAEKQINSLCGLFIFCLHRIYTYWNLRILEIEQIWKIISYCLMNHCSFLIHSFACSLNSN